MPSVSTSTSHYSDRFPFKAAQLRESTMANPQSTERDTLAERTNQQRQFGSLKVSGENRVNQRKTCLQIWGQKQKASLYCISYGSNPDLSILWFLLFNNHSWAPELESFSGFAYEAFSESFKVCPRSEICIACCYFTVKSELRCAELCCEPSLTAENVCFFLQLSTEGGGKFLHYTLKKTYKIPAGLCDVTTCLGANQKSDEETLTLR